MKSLIIASSFFSLISLGINATEMELKIEDVVNKVSKENYLVLENAERVYQGKENIKFSRASLLPKLNIWNLLKIPSVIVSPAGIGDIIQDVAPFLIPANWFRLGQARFMAKAQTEQYRALWANEVNTSKLLFMSVYRDQMLGALIDEKAKEYKEVLEIAKARNVFGQGNFFALNLIKDRYLSLNEDARNIDNLVYAEVKELQYLTGISNEKEVSLVAPTLPSLEGAEKIKFSEIIFKAIDASPEVFQYEHILNALTKLKGSIRFSILGTSTFSAGGGVFDNIPIQDGLGFGMGASVRIAKAEGRILKTQLVATIETIKKQTNVLVNEYNSLIDNLDVTMQRNTLAVANYKAMMGHIAIGGNMGVLEMMEVLDNLYSSKILLLSYRFRFSDLTEKLMRITFSGDYSNGPSLVAGKKTGKVSKKAFGNFKKALLEAAAAKETFSSTIDFAELNPKNLTRLKAYTDSIRNLKDVFANIIGSKKALKKTRKYFSSLAGNESFCRDLFLEEQAIRNLSAQCSAGKLNTCPISFGQYQENGRSIIENMQSVLGEDSITTEACQTFLNGEKEND